MVIALVDDMFFGSKIRATAEAVGREVRFPRDVESFESLMEKEKPALIIADLHSEKFNCMALIENLKKDERYKSIFVVGFFSHVETALRKRAEEAQFDRVLPRSAFTQQLAEILKYSPD